MSLLQMAAIAGNGAQQAYVDDVFSTYTYTGNGATQTITNGIDLSGQGGLVWCKARSTPTSHGLFDTARGINTRLSSNGNNGNGADSSSVTAFNSSGFSLGSDPAGTCNTSGDSYVSWTFRKASKFFDVVTYTGDGVAGRTVAHSLGVAPGMIIVKRTSDAGYNWMVYHRSIGELKGLQLNTTDAAITNSFWNNTPPTAAEFSLGGSGVSEVNASGASYVAYLFAHDTTTDGIIQCGSFLANASSVTTTLNWEPQLIMFKRSDSTGNWRTLDSSRGWPATGNPQELNPNLSAAETSNGGLNLTAAGFINIINDGGTYIYLAIRRPNKPPTSGTQVYNAIARTGTGAAATVTGVGFAPDLTVVTDRTATQSGAKQWWDRLRSAGARLNSSNSNAESTAYADSFLAFLMDGVSLGVDTNNQTNYSGETYINHFFRRAPGVFDVVCYTGTGSQAQPIPHSLTVAPELVIVKCRSNAVTNWQVLHAGLQVAGNLNSTGALGTELGYVFGNSATPSYSAPDATNFYVANYGEVNSVSQTYVAYLFATKAGISKVGSYTGNGTNQTINCGFTTGARFILIKRTDSTGDWKIIDSARGIVAGDDPTLALNSTAAEVTGTDCIDPASTGFIVVQETTNNLNVNGGTYVFLAFS